MTVAPSLAGHTFPAQHYEVGREKVREFIRAIGDTPAYDDSPDPAGRPLRDEDVVAPPTFVMVAVLRGFDQLVSELGVDYSRVIHADQRFSYARPVRAGDRLSTVATVESVVQRAGNDILGVRFEVTAADGDPVCTASATLLIRATGGGDD